jgi:hypothetical protein
MMATDGRQYFIGKGIEFPWSGKCLLPVSPTLPEKVLFHGGTLLAGRLGTNLTLRNGPWTYTVRVGESNFPDPDSILPHPGDTDLLVQLSEEDAGQIRDLFPLMPGAETPTRCVTLQAGEELDLHSSTQNTEAHLPLGSAFCMGEAIEISFNRDFLLRAIQLGHREFRFRSGSLPVFSSGKDSLFLFMPVTIQDNNSQEPEEEDQPTESEPQDIERDLDEKGTTPEETSSEEHPSVEEETETPKINPWEKRSQWLEREFAWRTIDHAVDLGVMDPTDSENEAEERLNLVRWIQKSLSQARKEAHVDTTQDRIAVQPPANKPKWESIGEFSTADGRALELLRSKDGFFSVKSGEKVNITREHVTTLVEPLLTNQWTPFTLALFYNGHAWWVDGEHVLERKGKSAKRRLVLTDYRPANPKHLQWEVDLLTHILDQYGNGVPVRKAEARLEQLLAWQETPPPHTLDLLALCLKFAKTA